MSDSSFPKSLDFSPDPLAISARAYEAVCVPETSQSATEGQIVRIRVPSGRAGTYLNPAKSFLAFTFTNTSTSTQSVDPSSEYVDGRSISLSQFYIDGSAYSLIQTMEIYNSSNLLESIQNYNLLMNIFMDLQISMSSRLTSGTILGMGGSGITDMLYRHYEGAAQFPTWAVLNVDGPARGSRNTSNTIVSLEYTTAASDTVGQFNAYTGLNILTAQLFAAGNSGEVIGLANTGPNIVVPGKVDYGAGVVDGLVYPSFTSATGPMYPPCNSLITDAGTGLGVSYSARCYPLGANGFGYRNGNRDIQNAYASKNNWGGGNCNGFISRLGPVVPFGQSMRFCLPLVSGVIGTLNCKLFPLNALNSDLLLNLTLASNNTVACNNWIPTHWNLTTGAETGLAGSLFVGARVAGTDALQPKYTLSEIEYHANIVEISANAQQMIDIATNGQYVIPSSSYRNFTAITQAGTTNNEFQVPARFTSLKSLIGCQRATDNLDKPYRFSLTSRIKNYMTKIQYRLGSLLVPPQPMRMENLSVGAWWANGGNASEVFCHLLESIGQSASDLDLEVGMDGNIYGANNDIEIYDQLGNATIDLVQASSSNLQSDRITTCRLAEGSRAGFCWGIDTESFSNTNCAGPLQSGTNCLGLNIMCRLYNDNLRTGTGDTISPSEMIVGTTIDHFAHFDMVIVVSGGVASVRF